MNDDGTPDEAVPPDAVPPDAAAPDEAAPDEAASPEPVSPGGDRPGRAAEVLGRLGRSHQRLRERYALVDLGTGSLQRFIGVDGSILAGYLAYRLFLLLLPLVVIVVAVSGYDPEATTDAAQHMRLGQAVATTIAQAGSDTSSSRLPLLITGLLGFTIAAWGLLGALQYVSARAWGIPTRKFPGKARAFLRLAGSLLLFGGILYLSALVRRAGLLAGMASSVATLTSAFIAFMGLAWILPRRCKEWFWLLPGAAVGAGGWAALQAVATFYLPNRLADASQTYGALGITLTLLTYMFLIGLFLTLAPVANAVVWEHYEGRPPGLLRRIAERVPIPTTRIGSGYVPDEGTAETTIRPPSRP